MGLMDIRDVGDGLIRRASVSLRSIAREEVLISSRTPKSPRPRRRRPSSRP